MTDTAGFILISLSRSFFWLLLFLLWNFLTFDWTKDYRHVKWRLDQWEISIDYYQPIREEYLPGGQRGTRLRTLTSTIAQWAPVCSRGRGWACWPAGGDNSCKTSHCTSSLANHSVSENSSGVARPTKIFKKYIFYLILNLTWTLEFGFRLWILPRIWVQKYHWENHEQSAPSPRVLC